MPNEVQVLNPDEERFGKIMSSKLESLDVARVTYSFLLSPPISGLPQMVLERLQNE